MGLYLKTISICFTCLFLPFMFCEGRDAGFLYSVKEMGFEYRFGSQNNRVLRLTADLHGVIDGKQTCPGFKMSYFKTRVLGKVKRKDGRETGNFFIGPGVSAGYVRDKGRGYGIMGAFCTNFGYDFKLEGGASIRIGLEGELGLHVIGKDAHDTSLTLYKNGIIKALIPQISINYQF